MWQLKMVKGGCQRKFGKQLAQTIQSFENEMSHITSSVNTNTNTNEYHLHFAACRVAKIYIACIARSYE